MKNYKSLSVYKGRDVYIFGASGGGEIVKDYLECHDVPIRAFVHSWIPMRRSGALPSWGTR